MTFSNLPNTEQKQSVVFFFIVRKVSWHSPVPTMALLSGFFRASYNRLTISLSWESWGSKCSRILPFQEPMQLPLVVATTLWLLSPGSLGAYSFGLFSVQIPDISLTFGKFGPFSKRFYRLIWPDGSKKSQCFHLCSLYCELWRIINISEQSSLL